MDALTQPELMRLRGAVPRLRLEDLFKIEEGGSPEVLAALEDYFHGFASWHPKERPEHPCLRCDKPLLGISAFLLGGGFEWGIAHGHGHCANCGWPAVAHHFVKDSNGEEILTLRNVVLQFHPDEVEVKASTRSAA